VRLTIPEKRQARFAIDPMISLLAVRSDAVKAGVAARRVLSLDGVRPSAMPPPLDRRLGASRHSVFSQPVAQAADLSRRSAACRVVASARTFECVYAGWVVKAAKFQRVGKGGGVWLSAP